jgi:hypothetical protein
MSQKSNGIHELSLDLVEKPGWYTPEGERLDCKMYYCNGGLN